MNLLIIAVIYLLGSIFSLAMWVGSMLWMIAMDKDILSELDNNNIGAVVSQAVGFAFISWIGVIAILVIIWKTRGDI